MNNEYTVTQLRYESDCMSGTGGTSRENRSLGFCPAFLDTDTGTVLDSVHADGSRAPIHLFDGLPESYIISRTADGGVKAVKSSLVAGFTLAGQFFTREQAASYLKKHHD